MKIVTLIENTGSRPDLRAEHGLSLYLETKSKKILFDMGQSDGFVHNAEKLGIDLSQVDFAVLSHGHYDHGGGLATFLKYNTKAQVYVHETAFGDYFNGTQKYIGLDKSLQNNDRLVFTKGEMQIGPDIALLDCNALGWEFDSYGLNCLRGSTFLPDDFHHEHYLQIIEDGRRFLFTGCSHKGILNIAEHFRPDFLLGGFHLNKVEDPVVLEAISHRLLQTNCRYYTGHCTGAKQSAYLKEHMADRLELLSTGTTIAL